ATGCTGAGCGVEDTVCGGTLGGLAAEELAGAFSGLPLVVARKIIQLSSPIGQVMGSAWTPRPITPQIKMPRASGFHPDITNLLLLSKEIAVMTIPAATASSIRLDVRSP